MNSLTRLEKFWSWRRGRWHLRVWTDPRSWGLLYRWNERVGAYLLYLGPLGIGLEREDERPREYAQH